jgi:hypothetical protein
MGDEEKYGTDNENKNKKSSMDSHEPATSSLPDSHGMNKDKDKHHEKDRGMFYRQRVGPQCVTLLLASTCSSS